MPIRPETLFHLSVGVLVAWAGFILWLISRIRYRVDQTHVRVVLGPVTLRKIRLVDIEFVDTQAPLWNEHWCNTYRPCGRIVRIRRRTGLIRNFIITPENRDEFIEQLREGGLQV